MVGTLCSLVGRVGHRQRSPLSLVVNEAPDVLSDDCEEPMARWDENGGYNLHTPGVVDGFFLQRWIHHNF